MKNNIDKLDRILNKRVIDWNEVERVICNLGESINMYDRKKEESILSEMYTAHQKTGYVNKILTELFLKHGFDVSANGGGNGASCLRALCWSSYDKYILPIAEKLLDAGANSTLSVEEEDDSEIKGVLSSISWKLGYWNTGEYDSANIFAAYYEMVDRHQRGKQYRGIRAFRESVGEIVTKVEKIKVYNSESEERISYLFYCGEKHLIASDYIEFMVDPYVRDEAVEIEDVSNEFKCILGAKIKGLRYFNSSLAKLNFDNGISLLIGDNDSMGNSKMGAWFKLTKSGQTEMPDVGTAIESIKLWGSISHASNSTFYSENTIVLNMADRAYGLYSHSTKYGEANVRVEGFEKPLVAGLHRCIEIHNPILQHIEYLDKAIKYISITCDEGVLYIVTNHFTEVAMFLSEYEIEKGEVLEIDSFTNGLKKINFLRSNEKLNST